MIISISRTFGNFLIQIWTSVLWVSVVVSNSALTLLEAITVTVSLDIH